MDGNVPADSGFIINCCGVIYYKNLLLQIRFSIPTLQMTYETPSPEGKSLQSGSLRKRSNPERPQKSLRDFPKNQQSWFRVAAGYVWGRLFTEGSPHKIADYVC